MDRRDLPVNYDPVVDANTPISQRRKRAIEVTADETASSPKEERFKRRKRAIESAEEAELTPPRSNHVTGEPSTTHLATTPNAAVLPASSVAGPSIKSLHLQEDDDDVDKQRMMWEALEEKQQVWDAIDEQQKLKKKEDKKEMQEKRMQKHEERRQKQENNKKRKLEVEAGKKEKRALNMNMIREVSPRTTRSPRVNMLRSRIGILASAAASKRERLRAENSPSEKTTRSLSMSPSPSPTTSKSLHSRGRKIRRLTSTVWKDFNPRYEGGKLVEAECKHCGEFLSAGREMGTSGVRRHLATCETRSDLHLIVQKLKTSISSPGASVLENWEFDKKTSRMLSLNVENWELSVLNVHT